MRCNPLALLATTTTVLSLLLPGCATTAPPTQPTPAKQAVAQPTPAAASGAAAPAPTPKPAADQPRYGGILIRANRHTIPHFDMHQETSAGIQMPLSAAYNGLVQNDPQDEDKIIGDLAKSWDVSADNLIYTFHLFAGVKFHDGKPMTAEDVKFNLDRVIFPPRGVMSPRKPLYAGVDGIQAPAPLTVKINLKEPQAAFLQMLALEKNFVFSPQIIKEKGDMKRDILGTGPFKFLSYTPDVSLKFHRNPDYFVKGRPYLDGITTYIIVDETARMAAMRTKQILMLPLISGLPGGQVEDMKKREPKLTSKGQLTPNITSLIPNTKKDPWNDARVRQAVNLATDRDGGAKVVRAGDYYPGYGYAVPGSAWALPEGEMMAMPGFRKPKDQDVAEAKRLLTEAGYPNGFKTTITTSTTVYAKETAEFGKNELGKIGINADVQVLETAVARDRLFKGTFDVASYADGSSHEDPDLLLNEYYITGSPKNYGAWSNPKYDELFAAQSHALDLQKRKEIVWEMQRVLHRESPRVIVTWGQYYAVWWDEVKNWTPHRSVKRNHKLQDVWLAR